MKINSAIKLSVIISLISVFFLITLNVDAVYDEYAESVINNANKVFVITNVQENCYIDTTDYPSIFSLYYMSQYRGGILDGIALGLSDKDLRKSLNKALNGWNILSVLKNNYTDVIRYKIAGQIINNIPQDREIDIIRDKEIEDYSFFNKEYGVDLILILRIREYLFTIPGLKLGVEVKVYSFQKNEVVFHKIIEVYKTLSLKESKMDNSRNIRKASIEISRKVGKIFLSALGYNNHKYISKELRDIKKHEIKTEMDKFSDYNDIMKWQNINLTKQEILKLQEEKEKALRDQDNMMVGRRSRRKITKKEEPLGGLSTTSLKSQNEVNTYNKTQNVSVTANTRKQMMSGRRR